MKALVLAAACLAAGSSANAETAARWEYTDADVQAGRTKESVAYDVAVDDDGEIYVAGWRVSISSGNVQEAVLRRLSTYGGVVWTMSNMGVGSTIYECAAKAVAVYPTGAGTSVVCCPSATRAP